MKAEHLQRQLEGVIQQVDKDLFGKCDTFVGGRDRKIVFAMAKWLEQNKLLRIEYEE
jgi:hypothetical protein